MSTVTLNRQVPDQELVRLYLSTADHHYFTQLYTRHRQRVFQQCLSYTNNADDADDFVQEIFLRLMQKLRGYRGEAQFTTWLRSLVTNYCLDQLRRKKREQALWCSYEIELTYGSSLITLVEEPVTHHAYERMLNKLPVMQRELLYNKYGRGISINDIAIHQGLTPSAVKMRIKRARELASTLYKQQLKVDEE